MKQKQKRSVSVKVLGSAVRSARKSKHLSQAVLAARVGVCKKTIVDLESSKGNPKFEILYRLVRELDIPLYPVFYPEVTENLETKNVLIQEINGCSEDEQNIILAMVRVLRGTTNHQ